MKEGSEPAYSSANKETTARQPVGSGNKAKTAKKTVQAWNSTHVQKVVPKRRKEGRQVEKEPLKASNAGKELSFIEIHSQNSNLNSHMGVDHQSSQLSQLNEGLLNEEEEFFSRLIASNRLNDNVFVQLDLKTKEKIFKDELMFKSNKKVADVHYLSNKSQPFSYYSNEHQTEKQSNRKWNYDSVQSEKEEFDTPNESFGLEEYYKVSNQNTISKFSSQKQHSGIKPREFDFESVSEDHLQETPQNYNKSAEREKKTSARSPFKDEEYFVVETEVKIFGNGT